MSEHGTMRAHYDGCRCATCVAAVPHGLGGYTNWKCRCTECASAFARRHHTERDNRRKRLEADSTLAQHGRYNTYLEWACRCEECKAANTAYQRGYRARLAERRALAGGVS